MLFNPEPGLIIWTAIVFLLLLLLLRRYAWGPLLASLERRERMIREALEKAEQARAEAERLNEIYQKKLAEARVDAHAILQEGRRAAERVKEEILEKARRQTDHQIDRARREIELSREKALDEIRRQTVELSLLAASKILERAVDGREQRRLVEEFLAELDKAAIREPGARR